MKTRVFIRSIRTLHKTAPTPWNGPWLLSCYIVEGLLVILTVWSLFTYTAAYWPYIRRALDRK